MSAVLKQPDTVHAVYAAAAVKSAAAAEVARLTLRLTVIEARAQQTLAERARHRQQVTEALLEDSPMPKAREPVAIEPDAALRVAREALKQAEEALADATSQHRAALVGHVEHRRAEPLRLH